MKRVLRGGRFGISFITTMFFSLIFGHSYAIRLKLCIVYNRHGGVFVRNLYFNAME